MQSRDIWYRHMSVPKKFALRLEGRCRTGSPFTSGEAAGAELTCPRLASGEAGAELVRPLPRVRQPVRNSLRAGQGGHEARALRRSGRVAVCLGSWGEVGLEGEAAWTELEGGEAGQEARGSDKGLGRWCSKQKPAKP